MQDITSAKIMCVLIPLASWWADHTRDCDCGCVESAAWWGIPATILVENSDKALGMEYEYVTTIMEQWAIVLRLLRERFTFDEGLSKAVRKIFVDSLQERLI